MHSKDLYPRQKKCFILFWFLPLGGALTCFKTYKSYDKKIHFKLKLLISVIKTPNHLLQNNNNHCGKRGSVITIALDIIKMIKSFVYIIPNPRRKIRNVD
jgi:hypothetical protein